MKKKKQPRWPNYDVVDLDKTTGRKIITFGTTLFMRKDKQALRIIFPAGQVITFCPQEEIEKLALKTK